MRLSLISIYSMMAVTFGSLLYKSQHIEQGSYYLWLNFLPINILDYISLLFISGILTTAYFIIRLNQRRIKCTR